MSRRKIHRRVAASFLALAIAATAAQEEDASSSAVDAEARGGGLVLHGEPVRRVQANRIDTWRIVDEQRLIFFTSPSRPYLVTLRTKAPRLRFNPIIGLKLRDNTIDARFDAIYVAGFPYAIERIERINRDVSDALLGIERRRAPAEGQPAPEDDG